MYTYVYVYTYVSLGFPSGSAAENLPAKAEDEGSSPHWKRCPGEGNGNLIWYSCLRKPANRSLAVLQSMGSQRIGHNLVTKHTYTHTYLSIFIRFFSIRGYCNILNTIPCAILYIFVCCIFYI